MDQPKSLCCAIIVVFTCFIFFYPPLPYLVNTHPIANLSISWINTPFTFSYDTVTDSFVLFPILIRVSTGTVGYGCGFYCDYNYTACLFAVVINKNVTSSIGNTINRPQVVWSANPNHPVKLNATLQLTQDGDLILEDADGTFVGSTNTGGRGKYSVSGLTLTEDGNLVLFDRNNATVWQSFDHPTDSLVLGQKLVPGQKLTASTSASNWSEGLLSLVVRGDGLYAYVESNPPQSYYYESCLADYPYAKFKNGSFNGHPVPPFLGVAFPMIYKKTYCFIVCK